MNETSIVERVQNEIKRELSNKEVVSALLATTFKGLTPQLMYIALREGMIRGFTFRDFLQKDVYALPFNTRNGSAYSIVTSIDFARKIASRTGQYFGKSSPKYEIEEGKILSCEVTVKKLVSGQVGEFTAMVDFSEYDGKRNLWISKPKTMIAKVAEMHALRMAFPEQMAKTYIEEELENKGRIHAVVEQEESSELSMHHEEKQDIPDEETAIQIEAETNKESAGTK